MRHIRNSGDIITINDCRPDVQMFAVMMEAKLRRNDHKGGWEAESYDYLIKRLRDEVRELQTALWPQRDLRLSDGVEDTFHAMEEAVDVGNFAMMIATNLLRQEPKGPDGGVHYGHNFRADYPDA